MTHARGSSDRPAACLRSGLSSPFEQQRKTTERLIQRAMRATGGNQTASAKWLSKEAGGAEFPLRSFQDILRDFPELKETDR